MILLLFELVLIARVVVDLVSNFTRSQAGYGDVLGSARRVIYQPVLAPVRRVVRPVRMGGVMLDLSVTVVFVAVVLLQRLVTVV
ncbi:MAG TPA: YggT family protein [Pseudonocardiaceae bacterium]|nr:YggT family protein [Pseudonocardiaceae bacterium]